MLKILLSLLSVPLLLVAIILFAGSIFITNAIKKPANITSAESAEADNFSACIDFSN